MEIDCQSVNDKRNRGDEFVLLDCREPDEYELVRIDGSQLLPMSGIQQRIGELTDNHDAEIVVYCHHGGRSLQVAMWLRQQGYQRAVSMAGGIDQWAVLIDSSLPRY